MFVKRLEIRKLYGYMNKKIDFNHDINLLVGINGSGKTSVLNVINWLLAPSLGNLCVIEFELLELQFEHDGSDYLLTCKQHERELTIDLKNTSTEYEYHRIQADFKTHPKDIPENRYLKDKLIDSYLNLGPDLKEADMWDFLFLELPSPVVIGLDRNMDAEEEMGLQFIEDSARLIRTTKTKYKNKNTPLENVIKLASTEYISFKNSLIELNDRLKNKIMLSSFDATLTSDNIGELLRSPKISVSQVKSLEGKVKKYFAENVLTEGSSKRINKKRQEEYQTNIQNYFLNLRKVIRPQKIEREYDLLYITNLNQFKKIKELIKDFEEFENKSDRLFLPIKQYLNAINLFLKDSSKELYFDKNNSELKYRILDKESKEIETNRDINTLSSGEKQILILFTFIKFNKKLGKLFIIDEPELSLHPKWQEGFLEGIKKIMPSGTQLLFATHSPSIVGKNKDYCKVLLPY